MGDKITAGDISDSTVALGRGARATSTTGEPVYQQRLRAELQVLADGLGGVGGEAAEGARAEVTALREAVTTPEQTPAEIDSRWRRVRAALAALGVTGAVAFGADLTEIAGGVHELLGSLGM